METAVVYEAMFASLWSTNEGDSYSVSVHRRRQHAGIALQGKSFNEQRRNLILYILLKLLPIKLNSFIPRVWNLTSSSFTRCAFPH